MNPAARIAVATSSEMGRRMPRTLHYGNRPVGLGSDFLRRKAGESARIKFGEGAPGVIPERKALIRCRMLGVRLSLGDGMELHSRPV